MGSIKNIIPIILICITVSSIGSSADNPTDEVRDIIGVSDSALNYFPLQIGNQWQYVYFYSWTWDTLVYGTYRVIADTLMPNGKKYFWLINDNLTLPFYFEFLRVDSSEKKVYAYIPGCPNEETALFTLYVPQENPVYEFCGGDGAMYVDSSFGTAGALDLSTKKLEFSNPAFVNETDYWYSLNYGIGLSLIGYTPGVLGFSEQLISATIGDTTYGEYVLEVQNKKINPTIFYLKQNFPNPFNSNTKIQFSIPYSDFVKLEVYDIKGKKVKTLLNNNLNKGNHEISWNGLADKGEIVASGIYIYTLEYNGRRASKKMLLIK